jgi:SAM-dependent methyltransferase
MRGGLLAPALLLLARLRAAGRALPREGQDKAGFPAADRPVAQIVSARWSTEEARDRLNEAERGDGQGRHQGRHDRRRYRRGRRLLHDPPRRPRRQGRARARRGYRAEVRDALAERVARERLDNVSVRLGLPANPRCPMNSFDRVLMVHMYHEIEQPYEFLWRMRPSLKPDGLVVVVDANRPTQNHGTPPGLLKCEFAAVG